ncbi:MAG: glutathione synthase [Pseudomonadota bacterium]
MPDSQSLRVAIQMDPLDSVDINGDTTFALAEAAQERGHTLWIYQPHDLTYDSGRVVARARPVTVQRVAETPGIFGDVALIDLASDVDVVLVRQDPPFDMAYITTCHILELVSEKTLVLNNPASVRSNPEKLYPLRYPDITPPTLISRDIAAIDAFRMVHGDIILKPLYSFGGKGVFKVGPGDPNLAALTEMFLSASPEPIVVQAFLPAIAEGDKRIILVNGDVAGGFNRVPQGVDTRSNMRVGGEPVPLELSDSDRAICERIGPDLKRLGQVLVGIDVIGDKLTEVNVTSPTGVQVLKRFTGIDAGAMFWDAAEEIHAERAQ